MIDGVYAPLSNNCDGSTRDFAASWPFYGAASLNVQVIVVATGLPVSPAPVLNGGADNDYTVIHTPDPDTGISPSGTVRFNVAPSAGYQAWRGRVTTDTQGKQFPTNGRFPAKSAEGALDIRTLASQEHAAAESRALRVPAYEAAPAVLPPAVTRASQPAWWDADGNLGVGEPIVVLTDVVGRVSSRAAMAATSFAAGQTSVYADGYAAAGDGGDALYKKVVAEPAHYAKVQSADGAWWAIATNRLRPAHLGALGTGADETTAMTRYFATCAALGIVGTMEDGLAHVVVNLPLVSNLTIEGNAQTSIKLKNDAAGPMFGVPGDIANLRMRGIKLDGNLRGQSVPKDLTNSIFEVVGHTISNSEFRDLTIVDVAGTVFCEPLQLTRCLRENITITDHYQSAMSAYADQCTDRGIRITNTLPGSAYAPYGMSINGSGNKATDIDITLTPHGSTTPLNNTVGLAVSGGDNFLDNITVDGNNNPLASPFSFNPGGKIRGGRLYAKNTPYYVGFEVLNPDSFHADLLDARNCLGSALFFGGKDWSIGHIHSEMGAVAQPHISVGDGGGWGFPTPEGMVVRSYYMEGGQAGIHLNELKKAHFGKGVMKNLSGRAVDATITGDVLTGIQFDGLEIDGADIPLALADITNSSFRNFNAVNVTHPQIIQLGGTSGLTFENLRGLVYQNSTGHLPKGMIGGVLHTYWSFALHGGAVSTIDLGEQIPAGMEVTRVEYRVVTAPTSAGSLAQIALGTMATHARFKAALVISDGAWSAAGNGSHAGIQDGAPANNSAAAAASNVALTVSVEALTAGVIQLFVHLQPAP